MGWSEYAEVLDIVCNFPVNFKLFQNKKLKNKVKSYNDKRLVNLI